MIKRVLQYLLLVVAVVLLPLACKGREETRASDGTETIAPAAARPDETSSSEMTQTVEIPDNADRPPTEGGTGADTPTATATAPPVTGTSGSAPTTATTRTQ